MSLEDLAHSQKAAEADPGARLQALLCAVSSVPQNESTPPCYSSWVSLPKFLVFLAKLREVNLAEKPNSKLWIWMSWASMSPSLQSLYIALSPSEKGHSVKFIFQFKVHDLGWRAPGFWFHFPTASHLQFSLCITLTSSGHASSPFPVCPGGYACSENRPRTHLWYWGQAGQPALPPWG